MPDLPHDQANTPPQRSPARSIGADGWLMLIAAAGLVVYGVWQIVTYKSEFLGPGAIGLGLTLTPWRVLGIIGGVGLLVLGGLTFYQGYQLQGGLAAILGLVGIAERVRRN